MTIKETNKNLDTNNTEEKPNNMKKLVSSYRKDILQRHFRAEGGKSLLYSIIVICLGRGLIGKFVFHETLLYAFLYPLIIVGVVSGIYIPLKLISFKSSKISRILEKVLLIICCTVLILVFLLVIILILNKFLHFWF